MNFTKNEFNKWKWRPKRWWICLIVFWLFSTSGARLFGVEPKTSEQSGFIMIITFLALIFAAITDREYSIPKRILWVVLASIAYGIISGFGAIIIGDNLSTVLTSLIIVIFAMRQSKLFVEPVDEAKIE